MTDAFKPLFDDIASAIKSQSPVAAAFNMSNRAWIAYGLPPLDPNSGLPNGPLPCIRVDGISSTNNAEANEYTAILNVWTEGNQSAALVNLAKGVETSLNDDATIYSSSFTTRQEGGLGRAIFSIRFTL